MGFWLCLQNCHLSLSFCEEIMQTVIDSEEIHANFRYSKNPTYNPIKWPILQKMFIIFSIIFHFRVWLTTESNINFPIGLLQMSLKFTNEPPQGIRASLKRTYADVTQDTLDYSNHPSWPSLLYSVAFLHTVVQVKYIYKGWKFIFKNCI